MFDAKAIHAMMHSFASELGYPESVSIELDDLATRIGTAIFGQKTLICETGDDAVGYALFYVSNVSFRARMSVLVEDIYVSPDFRGRSLSKEMFAHIARIAAALNCESLKWVAYNTSPAGLALSRAVGGTEPAEWVSYWLDTPALHRLAGFGER